MPRRREVSDAQITRAARKVFLEQGTQVPVAVVAKELGVSPATLFSRMGTKNKLISAALWPPDPPVLKALEEGGKVPGPRFANGLRWEADGARFSMVYRNGIGQEIRRTGKLNGLNRLEGEAVGPDGKTWRWVAEAKPL